MKNIQLIPTLCLILLIFLLCMDHHDHKEIHRKLDEIDSCLMVIKKGVHTNYVLLNHHIQQDSVRSTMALQTVRQTEAEVQAVKFFASNMAKRQETINQGLKTLNGTLEQIKNAQSLEGWIWEQDK